MRIHDLWRRRGGAALAAAALAVGPVVLLGGTGTAVAADAMGAQIVSWEPQPDGSATAVFGLTNPTPGATIDPSTITVLIDGQKVPATAKPIGDATSAPVRRTVLTFDVSGSMGDPTATPGVTKIQAAKQAAKAYLDAVPADVQVGLVTFADQVNVVIPPTTDHRKVQQAVDGLATGGGTHLYDGVIRANQVLGTGGARNQLVLSDGKDETSSASLAQAAANVAASKVSLDAVALGVATADQLKALNTLAKAGRGQVVTNVDAAGLAKTFEQQAASQASQVLVSVTIPSTVAGTSKNVTIAASAGGQSVGDTGFYIMPAAPTPGATDAFASYGPVPVASTSAGITGQSWFLPVAIGAVGLGLFALLGIAFTSGDNENQTAGRVRRRLSRYSLSSRPDQKQSNVPTSGALGQSQVARSATEFAGRVAQNRDIDSLLALKLDAAGLPLRPGEWLLIHVGIAVLAGLVMALLTGFSVLPTLLGLGIGLLAPYLYLSSKESRRKSAFDTQLPGTLQLLAGSLAAGYSLPQAVDTVVREAQAPMSVELNRALVESRLGVPMEDALEAVAQRMDSVDMSWVVMAIRIQREVGGNLAEVLTTVAATMRERERLRRQVQVLSAEGRLSAIILGALPVVFAIYLVLVRPEYIGILITSPLGIIMIVVGLVLMIAGVIWLRRVVRVEV